jgi:hypothetical protein
LKLIYLKFISQEVQLCVQLHNTLFNLAFNLVNFLSWGLSTSLGLLSCSDRHKKFCHLVGILTWGWHLDRACPIEIKVAQSKCQVLKFLFSQARWIPRNIKMSWKNTPLICSRWCQKEIEFFTLLIMTFDEPFVNDAPRRRIRKTALAVLNKETLWNPLIHNNDRDLRPVVLFDIQKIDCFLKLRNLTCQYLIALSITHSVSVNYKVCWELTIMMNSKLLNRLHNAITHIIFNNLLSLPLNQVISVILTHLSVGACSKAYNRLRTRMTDVNPN